MMSFLTYITGFFMNFEILTIWKGTTQGSFQQSLVEIGSVGSEEKIFIFFSSPFSLSLAWRPSWLEMSFLTYITGFFMNFEILTILTDYAN
jgi:hypothetical protein